MSEPIEDRADPAWHEPDGAAVEVGLHPHYALWNHETQKWDPTPEPLAAALDALREALQEIVDAEYKPGWSDTDTMEWMQDKARAALVSQEDPRP